MRILLSPFLYISLLIFSTGVSSDNIKILEASISELQSSLASGEFTSKELVSFYLRRIEAYDKKGPSVNAISNINPQALKIAETLDKERADKKLRGPLHGIPVVIKDNYETVEMPTAVGSVLFANWNPGTDAELVKRLRDAGAIVLAKTNMHEYAMGLKTVGSLFGQTLNPYALNRYPGGSSGGTAVAVTANFAAVGMGSDTCSSIRGPSAHNSLVGLRGTQGLASRAGIFPLSHTQDFGGPLARSVSDIAIVFDVIAGYDSKDPQTAASVGNIPDSYTEYLRSDGLQGARIGLLFDFMEQGSGAGSDVSRLIRHAKVDMEKLGATVIELETADIKPLLDDGFGGFKLIIMEFSSGLRDYLARHKNVPVNNVEEIIAGGKFDPDMIPKLGAVKDADPMDSKEYYQLVTRRNLLREVLLNEMAKNKLDALLYPTSSIKAALIGEEQLGNNCFLSSNSGLPAISVPAGFTEDGVPVGLELLARAWDEPLLLKLAYAYEQGTLHRRPPTSTPSLTD